MNGLQGRLSPVRVRVLVLKIIKLKGGCIIIIRIELYKIEIKNNVLKLLNFNIIKRAKKNNNSNCPQEY